MSRRHRYGSGHPNHGPFRWLRVLAAAVTALAATVLLVALGDDDDDDDDEDDDDGHRAPRVVVTAPLVPGDA